VPSEENIAPESIEKPIYYEYRRDGGKEAVSFAFIPEGERGDGDENVENRPDHADDPAGRSNVWQS